jgi:hypothetical protein
VPFSAALARRDKVLNEVSAAIHADAQASAGTFAITSARRSGIDLHKAKAWRVSGSLRG